MTMDSNDNNSTSNGGIPKNNNNAKTNISDMNGHVDCIQNGNNHYYYNNHTTTTTNNNSNNDCVDNDDDSSSHYYYYLNAVTIRQNLKHHVYRGYDNSFIYKYVLSPVAQYCVDHFTPRTLSPNLITLIGLVLMVSSYFVYWYFVPTVYIDGNVDEDSISSNSTLPTSTSSSSYPPPRWMYLFNCICMLLYQTLDNMDGKQARRTNTSSPLGQIFDHGCDAINSIFGSTNWLINMYILPHDDPVITWIVIFGPIAQFYITTWEEYYNHILILPVVNGPSEGLLLGALLSYTSYLYGNTYWQTTTWYDTYLAPIWSTSSTTNESTINRFVSSMVVQVLPLQPPLLRNCDLVVIAASIGFVQEIVMKVYTVGKKHGFYQSLQDLLPIIVLCVSFGLIGYYQPTILWNMPRTCLAIVSIVFTEMTTQLMLCYVTKQFYSPYQRYLLVPLLLLVLYVVVIGTTTTTTTTDTDTSSTVMYMDTDTYLLMYMSGSFVYLAFKIVLVIHEICSVLQIQCFSITKNIGSNGGGKTTTTTTSTITTSSSSSLSSPSTSSCSSVAATTSASSSTSSSGLISPFNNTGNYKKEI